MWRQRTENTGFPNIPLHPAFPHFNHLLMRQNKLARCCFPFTTPSHLLGSTHCLLIKAFISVFSPFIYLYIGNHLFNPSSFYVAQSLLPGLSKRRKEEVAKKAEYEEANNPVDWVDVDDDHVHVKAPAPRVVLKVHGVQAVASSVGELASGHGTWLPLEAWIGVINGFH